MSFPATVGEGLEKDAMFLQLERGQFLFHYWLCFVLKNTSVHGLFQIFMQPDVTFERKMLRKEVPSKKYGPSKCKILFWDTALVYLKCRRIYCPHSTGEMSPLCLVFSNVSSCNYLLCSELKNPPWILPGRIFRSWVERQFSKEWSMGYLWGLGEALGDHCRLQASAFQLRGWKSPSLQCSLPGTPI